MGLVAGIFYSGLSESVSGMTGKAAVLIAAGTWLGQAVWRKGLSITALFGPVPNRRGWGWVFVGVVAMDLLGSAQFHLLVPWLERVAPTLADWYTLSSVAAPSGAADFAYLLWSGVIVAPILEETLFRGILYQRWAYSWGRPVVALVATALPWAALHGHVLDAFVFSIVTTLLYLRTRSLWAPIAMHALGNLVNIPGVLSVKSGFAAATGVSGDAAFGWSCLAVSMPLLIWFVWWNASTLWRPLPYIKTEAKKRGDD